MPTVCFRGPRRELDKTVDAPEGGALVDLCDEVLAPVPFSCRSASCGTCVVRVVTGAEHLAPPDEPEAELLELMGQAACCRLACQAALRPGPGYVELDALEKRAEAKDVRPEE